MILTAIAQRACVPWYRRSWATWPAALQATAFAVLVMLFGALCLAGGELSQIGTATFALRQAGEWLSRLDVIVNTFSALANAAVLTVNKLGAGFFIPVLVLMGLGYALFVGLGTVYFRLGFAKR
jgi:hypothetical protein